MIPETELTADRLCSEIFSLLDQPREIEKHVDRCAQSCHAQRCARHRQSDGRSRPAHSGRGGIYPVRIARSAVLEETMMVSFRNFQRIHLVGIGGIGMSGIAEVLLTLGYSVSGSDTKPSPITERLQNLGATIYEGHKASNVDDAHVVVTSSAIKSDNPEVVEAHKQKIPVIPRAEMLAELMRLKYGIAVAGAHGKTTTTSMVASVLAAAHLDPTFVIGGRVNQAGTTRAARQRRILRRGSRRERPQLPAARAGRRRRHHHRSRAPRSIHLARRHSGRFIEFVNRVPFYGAAILCLDEPNVQAIIPNVKRPIITYGTSSQADLVISDVKLEGLGSEFRLTYKGDDLGLFHLPHPPGIHNVRNAAAAAAVALYLNVPARADPRRPGEILPASAAAST